MRPAHRVLHGLCRPLGHLRPALRVRLGRLPAPFQIDVLYAPLQRFILERALDEPVTLILGTAMATIRTLQKQLQALDTTIAREVLALPPERRTISSVPGLGPVWTVGLAAKIGNIHRFRNEAALAHYAPLALADHPQRRQ
jgi:transposase